MIFFKTPDIEQTAEAKEFLSGLKLPALPSADLAKEISLGLDPFDSAYSQNFIAGLTRLSPKTAGDSWPKWLEFCQCDEVSALRRATTILLTDKRGRFAALLHSFFVHTDPNLWPEVRKKLRHEKERLEDPLSIALLSDTACVAKIEEQAQDRNSIKLQLASCCPISECEFDWKHFGGILNSLFTEKNPLADSNLFREFAGYLRAREGIRCGNPEAICENFRTLIPEEGGLRPAIGEIFEILSTRQDEFDPQDIMFFHAMVCERLDFSLFAHAMKECDAGIAEEFGNRLLAKLPASGNSIARKHESRLILEDVELHAHMQPPSPIDEVLTPCEMIHIRRKEIPYWAFLSKEAIDLAERLKLRCHPVFELSPRKLLRGIVEKTLDMYEFFDEDQIAIIEKAAYSDKFFNALMKWDVENEEDAGRVIELADNGDPYLTAFARDEECVRLLVDKTFLCPFKFMRRAVYSHIGTDEFRKMGGIYQLGYDLQYVDRKYLTRVAGILCEAAAERWLPPDADLDYLARRLTREDHVIESTPEAGALPFMMALGVELALPSQFVVQEIRRVGMPVIMEHAARDEEWAGTAYAFALHCEETRQEALSQIGSDNWLHAGGKKLHATRVALLPKTFSKKFSLDHDLMEAVESELLSPVAAFVGGHDCLYWFRTGERRPSALLAAAGNDAMLARLTLNCLGLDYILGSLADGSDKDPAAYLACFNYMKSPLREKALSTIGTPWWEAAGGWNLYALGKNTSGTGFDPILAEHAFLAMKLKETDEERREIIDLVASAHASGVIDDAVWGTFIARTYVVFGVIADGFAECVTPEIWADLPNHDPDCKVTKLRKLAKSEDFPGRFVK